MTRLAVAPWLVSRRAKRLSSCAVLPLGDHDARAYAQAQAGGTVEVGRIIGGKYRLTREIGEGAMGSVWAAAHELLGRSVAIKFMRPALEDADTAAARFVAEAKAAAQLKHRFIVDVFDFGITDDGQYYMVQELLDGESLAHVEEQGPAWPVQEVVRFAAQCLSGLSAVHTSGVVHRDLKPENIFVMHDAEGRFPKLLDFGISKSSGQLERDSGREPKRASLRAARSGRMRHLTAVGAAPGTPAYMSPEQLRNQSDLDGRADLYSLGVVLYEWLSGRVPYQGSSDFPALYRAIHARTMTPLERLRPDLEPALCAVIARALAPEAKDRFANANEMRDALLASLPRSNALLSVVQTANSAARIGQETQVLLESAGDPFAEPDEARFLPRVPLVRGALAGLTLLALGAGVWLAMGSGPTPSGAPEASAAVPSLPVLPQPSANEALEKASAARAPDATWPAPPSARELPIGADMPEEDLPVLLPAELRPGGVESKHAHVAAHEKRRERARPASAPTDTSPANRPSAQNGASGSSESPDRPIRQKVVRQLDF